MNEIEKENSAFSDKPCYDSAEVRVLYRVLNKKYDQPATRPSRPKATQH